MSENFTDKIDVSRRTFSVHTLVGIEKVPMKFLEVGQHADRSKPLVTPNAFAPITYNIPHFQEEIYWRESSQPTYQTWVRLPVLNNL